MKKPNATDTTLRNNRATGKRLAALEASVKRLQARVRALEKAPADLEAAPIRPAPEVSWVP